MARANEFLFFFDPGNSTTKVCANCRQDDQFAFGIFGDVNGLFCDRLAPAVALLDGDQLLYRRINVLKLSTLPTSDHDFSVVRARTGCKVKRTNGTASSAPTAALPAASRPARKERRFGESVCGPLTDCRRMFSLMFSRARPTGSQVVISSYFFPSWRMYDTNA